MTDSDSDDDVQRRTVKITVIGEPMTGKSSLCARYLGFNQVCGSTQGAVVLAGECIGLRPTIPLQLCDVSGNTLNTQMLGNYLYASDIIIFVYDLTNLQSFEKLSLWVKAVKDILANELKKPLMALFGNKTDMEHQRAVRLSCVQKFSSEHLLESFKGSARTGEMEFVAQYNPRTRTHIELLLSQIKPFQINDSYLGNSDVGFRLVQTLVERCREKIVIEKFTDNVRFCLICNYLGKIIPALQSRCTRFRFAPLNSAQIVPRLNEIAVAEGVTLSEDGVKALLTLSGGDMRKVLNTLQSTWLAYRRVTEDTVYTCVGHPLRTDINNVLNWLLNENDFADCFKNIQDLKILKGLALTDILTEIHMIIQRLKLPPEVLVELLIKMCDAEARLANGASERVELAALVAAFMVARDRMPPVAAVNRA